VAVFSRDGRRLYTAGVDGTVIAWDLTGDSSVRRPFTFTHDRGFDRSYDAHPGTFSPDGRLIAVGLKGDGIALLDARRLTRSGALLLDTGGEVKALAFAPDGRTLAAVTSGGTATMWDLESRSPRHESIFVGGYRVAAAFSPDGATLTTTGVSGGVNFRDVATGAGLGTLGRDAFYPTSGVAYSSDGTLVAFAQTGGGVPRGEVWRVGTRSRVAVVRGGAEGDAYSVALSPDGSLLAIGGYPTVVRLWDVATGTLVHALRTGGSDALEFSRDGRILAVSGGRGASLWDVATGVQIGPSLTVGRRGAMLDLSSDGRFLLMTAANGQGAVWDVDPESWARRACAVANRNLTRAEWERFLPGRPYEPACSG
jgi:WD40 repeat protein